MNLARGAKAAFLLSICIIVTSQLSSCSGGGSSSSHGGPQDPPYVSSFSAFPSAIASGQISILSVYVSNAASVSISPAVGSVSSSNIPVKPQQTTTYTLTAANSVGTVTRQITVVVDAPAIVVQPEDVRVTVTSSATFSVTAQGASLSYQWRKNGADIPGATGPNYTTASTVRRCGELQFSSDDDKPGR